MGKVLRCGDLMSGCKHVIRAATVDEALRQVATHAPGGPSHQRDHAGPGGKGERRHPDRVCGARGFLLRGRIGKVRMSRPA